MRTAACRHLLSPTSSPQLTTIRSQQCPNTGKTAPDLYLSMKERGRDQTRTHDIPKGKLSVAVLEYKWNISHQSKNKLYTSVEHFSDFCEQQP
jgi:hypothetical protein